MKQAELVRLADAAKDVTPVTDIEDLETAAQLAEDTIALVAMRERRIEILAAALRAEGEALASDRAISTEAIAMYARAADRVSASVRSRRVAA